MLEAAMLEAVCVQTLSLLLTDNPSSIRGQASKLTCKVSKIQAEKCNDEK